MSRLSVQEPLRPKTQKRLSVCFCVLRLCEGKECTAGAWALLWTGPQGFSCFLSGTPCAEARRLRGPAGRGVQCRPPTAGVPAYWLRDGASISTASLSLSLSLSLSSSSFSVLLRMQQLRLRPCAKPSGRPALQVTDTIDSFLGCECGESSFGGLATGFAASRSAAAKCVGRCRPTPRPVPSEAWTCSFAVAPRWGARALRALSCSFGCCRVWPCSTGP